MVVLRANRESRYSMSTTDGIGKEGKSGPDRSAPSWCDVGHRQIPVGQQDLEPSLLLMTVGLLVGPELPNERLFPGVRRRRHGRVAKRDGDAIVPSRILGHVVGGRFDLHRQHPAALDAFLEQGIMVLEE